eukprot:TRINITY_DN3497_c1_g2_i2.p1 TRINITY_DN3497_c1_g2~~TRINITY_DN3497_c1_g2_i2.p1  ORF type:complete len:223 (+),score=64.51 TRINITY_DN3497_c1_g2_i2:25-669(+)
MGWFERVISMDGKLTGKERSDRRLIFVVSTMQLVWTVPPTLMLLATSDNVWPLMQVSLISAPLKEMMIQTLCLCHYHITHNMLRFFLILGAMSITVTDYNMRTVGSQPVWPFFVLLADLSLVLRLGTGFATSLIVVAAVWVVVSCGETILRVGLFDLPGSAPDSHRWERVQDTVSCTDPPCPVSALQGVYEMMASLLVLFVDFAATRSFADAAE